MNVSNAGIFEQVSTLQRVIELKHRLQQAIQGTNHKADDHFRVKEATGE